MIQAHFLSGIHNPEGNRLAGQFVSKLIWGVPDRFGPHCSMAIVDDGTLIAGVIYHNVDEDAGVVELSAASISRRWAPPHILRKFLSVPYDLLGCQMSIHRVKASNTAHVRQMRRLGHKEYVIERGAGRDDDLHVFSMTDDAWAAHPLNVRALDRKPQPGV